MHKLNKIRNLFAHSNQAIVILNKNGSLRESGVMDPKNPDNYVEFENKYKEFVKLEPEVMEYLIQIYREIGGKFIK